MADPESAMFVHDFLQIPQAYEDVRAAILSDPHSLIDANVAAACKEGEQICLRLETSQRHPRLGKKVWVDIGEVYLRRDGLVLPIHWWAKGMTNLFPRLDADLEAMPVGASTTQLTFSGRYDPPLGALGQGLDKMLLHRVVEGSVRSFLHRLSAALQEDVQLAPGGERPVSARSAYQTEGHTHE